MDGRIGVNCDCACLVFAWIALLDGFGMKPWAAAIIEAISSVRRIVMLICFVELEKVLLSCVMWTSSVASAVSSPLLKIFHVEVHFNSYGASASRHIIIPRSSLRSHSLRRPHITVPPIAGLSAVFFA